MALAIDNIKRGETFFSSIVFLKKVLNTYPLEAQVKFKSSTTIVTVQTILHEIFKKNDLFDLILVNLSEYLRAQRSRA